MFPDRWWTKDSDELASAVMSTSRRLYSNAADIRSLNLRHVMLYGDLTTNGYLPAATWGYQDSRGQKKLTLNVIQSVVDSATAKIAASKPKPTFLTSGGDFQMQRKAKNLDKFCRGLFYKTKVYDKAIAVFKDAATTGTGVAHVYREGDEVRFERVWPGEIFIDEREGLNGNPRQLMRTRWVDKDKLASEFPTHADAIRECRAVVDDEDAYTVDTISNQVKVVEAWHLPSKKKAGDGKWVLAVENTVLQEEPWARDHFPFVFYRWNDRLRGFWGQGIAEQLTGIQVEINVTLLKIQRALHLLSNPRVYLERGSKIVRNHMTNEIGAQIEYTGNPPIQATPPAVNPELYAHVDRLYNKAYEIAGISLLDAQARKPPGLESGEAIRTYKDSGDGRQAIPMKQWDRFFMEITERFLEEAREAYADGVDMSVTAGQNNQSRKFLQSIKWSEVDLEADAYIMQMYPTNSLPSDPSGRLARLNDMLMMGMIDQQTARRLYDFPDLEAEESLMGAVDAVGDRIVEDILDGKEPYMPEPHLDLNRVKARVLLSYNRAIVDGADEDTLEAFRSWLSACESLAEMAAPPPQPAMPGAEGLPPDLGGMPPDAMPPLPPEMAGPPPVM